MPGSTASSSCAASGAHRRDDAAGLVAGDHAGLSLDAAGHDAAHLARDRDAVAAQLAEAEAALLDLYA